MPWPDREARHRRHPFIHPAADFLPGFFVGRTHDFNGDIALRLIEPHDLAHHGQRLLRERDLDLGIEQLGDPVGAYVSKYRSVFNQNPFEADILGMPPPLMNGAHLDQGEHIHILASIPSLLHDWCILFHSNPVFV